MIAFVELLSGERVTFESLIETMASAKISKSIIVSIYQICVLSTRDIARGLKDNKTLVTFDIQFDNIPNEALLDLMNILEENKILRHIPIRSNTDIFSRYPTENHRKLSEFAEKIAKRNYNTISKIADSLISGKATQTDLYDFMEDYTYVMRDFLIQDKNQSPEQADEIIQQAKNKFNPIEAANKVLSNSTTYRNSVKEKQAYFSKAAI